MGEKIKIKKIIPEAVIEEGIIEIYGEGFDLENYGSNVVMIDGSKARILFLSEEKIIVRVPSNVNGGEVMVKRSGAGEDYHKIILGHKLADDIHSVDNPVVDNEGNWYVTFSGKRDEIPPISIFKITPEGVITPYIKNIKNATSMAFDSKGTMYVSSRFEGVVYKVNSSDDIEVFAENLGVPTGIAINKNDYVFVGDRTGRIFKISPQGEVSLFADLPESLIAYHLAFDADDNLFVSIPGISSLGSIYMIDKFGKAVLFYSGFGRPQGIAFDQKGNLYICESKVGDSYLWRLDTKGELNKIVSASSLVGIAFDRRGNVGLTTPYALYKLPLNIY